MFRLPTEPLAPMALLFRGLELGAHSFLKLFMATTLYGLVTMLPNMYIAVRLGDDALTPSSQLQFMDGRWGAIELLSLLAIMLFQGIVITRVDHIAREGRTDLRLEWHSALRALLPLIGALFLCIGVFLLTAVAAGIGGMILGFVSMLFAGKAGMLFVLVLTLLAALLYVSVYLLFIQYSIVLDQRNPLDAMNGSFTLVYGRWWKTFYVLLVMLLLLCGVALLVCIPLVPVLGSFLIEQTGRGLLVRSVLVMVGSAVFGPFGLAVMYLLYLDLKMRKQVPA